MRGLLDVPLRLVVMLVAVATLPVSAQLSGLFHCTGADSTAPGCAAGTQALVIERSNPWSLHSSWTDLRFEIRSGDVAAWDAAHQHSAERTEVSNSSVKEPVDQDIWFSFGMLIEPGDPITSPWVVVGQLHPSEDPGDISPSPAWAQEFDANDEFRIVIRTNSQKPITSSPAPTVLWSSRGPGNTFQRGRTYRFVYHLVHSQTNGRLETWRDGVKIVDYSGPIGFINSQGPWFKFGIYRAPAPETLAVHYYGIQMGGAELRPQ